MCPKNNTHPNRTSNSMYCCGDVTRRTSDIPWYRAGCVVSRRCFIVTRSFDGHWTVMRYFTRPDLIKKSKS